MNDWVKMEREAKKYKEMYPAGTRILLNNMNDPYAPVPSGTRGTVDHVDDIGQIHMKWDNGRTLPINPGEDDFRKLTDKELVEEQLTAKATFLEDFFWAQHITMDIEVVDGDLVAEDDDNNKWVGAKEIYDFALNECLCFELDGSLSDGLGAAEPFVEQLKADAKEFGVKITSYSMGIVHAAVEQIKGFDEENCSDYLKLRTIDLLDEKFDLMFKVTMLCEDNSPYYRVDTSVRNESGFDLFFDEYVTEDCDVNKLMLLVQSIAFEDYVSDIVQYKDDPDVVPQSSSVDGLIGEATKRSEEEISNSFPYLSQSADFDVIKKAFSNDMLKNIEENIRLYEETDLIEVNEETLELSHKEGKDIFQAAIAWHEGMLTTESFVSAFGDIELTGKEME